MPHRLTPERTPSPLSDISQTAISNTRLPPEDIRIYKFSVMDFVDIIQPVQEISRQASLAMFLLEQKRLIPAWTLTKNLNRLEKSVILAFAITQKQFLFAKVMINMNTDQSFMVKMLDKIPDLTAMQVYDQLGFLKGPISFKKDNFLLLE